MVNKSLQYQQHSHLSPTESLNSDGQQIPPISTTRTNHLSPQQTIERKKDIRNVVPGLRSGTQMWRA